ncbi:MAG TPA: hypothetical protein VFP06_18950 [Acidimicrobiales bacterium]|nr:hypothetical protein [Acidimicrobiales bacterium]
MATQPEIETITQIERLRAERDALRAEVEGLRARAQRRGWLRQTVAALLVALACVVLVAAVVGIWARRNFLDTGRFTDRAGPLIEEPAVQAALGARLTEQLMVLVDPEALFEEVLPERGQILAVPLANAVEGFVGDQVESFLATEQFERLWVAAIEVAHGGAVRVLRGESEAVTTADGQITLNLLPVVNAVLAEITAQSPEILGREVDLPDVTVDEIPEAAISRIEGALGVELGDDFGQFTVYDEGTLAAAQDAISLFDRLVVVLLLLGILLAALALWLSRRRRRTLLQLAAGLAIGMVLIRRVGFRLQDEVAALPPRPNGQESAALAAEAFLRPLTTFGAWVLAGVAVVAAVAVLTGDYRWVVSLRRRAALLWTQAVTTTGERARDEATVAWITRHRDALLAAGGVAALLILWAFDLSWLGLLLALGLIAAYEVAVYRIGSRPEAPETGAPTPPAAAAGTTAHPG